MNHAYDAVRLMRGKLDMQAGATLVVCVDELMKMPWDRGDTRLNMTGRLIQELLLMQDTIAEPLVFLFSAVTEKMLDAAEMASHRRKIPAKLPRLSEEQLQKLLFHRHPRLEQFKNLPMFELLLKLCAPTPRYALEGLPSALANHSVGLVPSDRRDSYKIYLTGANPQHILCQIAILSITLCGTCYKGRI